MQDLSNDADESDRLASDMFSAAVGSWLHYIQSSTRSHRNNSISIRVPCLTIMCSFVSTSFGRFVLHLALFGVAAASTRTVRDGHEGGPSLVTITDRTNNHAPGNASSNVPGVSLVFGSCLHHDLRPWRVFDAILNSTSSTGLDRVLLIGDTVYPDWENAAELNSDPDHFDLAYASQEAYGSLLDRSYKEALAEERFKRFRAVVDGDALGRASVGERKLFFTWDDHELKNDFDFASSNWTRERFLLGRRKFQEYLMPESIGRTLMGFSNGLDSNESSVSRRVGESSSCVRSLHSEVASTGAVNSSFSTCPVGVESHDPEPSEQDVLYYHDTVDDPVTGHPLLSYFVLDTRSYRDAFAAPDVVADSDKNRAAKSMLGATQLRGLLLWLDATQQHLPSAWKLIVSSTPFHEQYRYSVYDGKPLSDSWIGYRREREAIFDFIREKEVRNVVLLSGDMHWSGVFEFPRVPGGLYEVMC